MISLFTCSGWIDKYQTLLTGIIAVIPATIIGLFSINLACRKRKDDLFDRRYAIYQQLSEMAIDAFPVMNRKIPLKDQPAVQSFDTNKPEIAFLPAKARFLFDDNIGDQVLEFLELYNSKQKEDVLSQKQIEKIRKLINEEDTGLFIPMAKYLRH